MSEPTDKEQAPKADLSTSTEQLPFPLSNGEKLAVVEQYRHWWRTILAGLVAVGVGCFDEWVIGKQNGFTSSVNELLVIAGVALIAGVAPERIRAQGGATRTITPPKG